MRKFLVVAGMVLAFGVSSVQARITAEDVQAIAEAVSNAITANGGVNCKATTTAVVDPAAGEYTCESAPKTFQALKLKRNGTLKPTRTFLKAVN